MDEKQLAKAMPADMADAALEQFKVLDNEQMQHLLATVSEPRDYLVLAILYETGCNLKELTGIKVDDVQPGSITFGGRNARKSAISEELSALLVDYIARKRERRQWKGGESPYLKSQWYMRNLRFSDRVFRTSKVESDYLFSTRQSATMSDRRIRQLVKRYAGSVGLDMKSKQLRYSHVAHAYQQQQKIAEIGRQTGLKRLRLRQIIRELG